MNVSSVSSSSVWREEYLEKQRKQQAASSAALNAAAADEAAAAGIAAGAAAGVLDLTPEKILEELQALRDDPEKLKAKAAELAAQVTKKAESAGGVHAAMLKELASDLETVAESGDFSFMEEKIARGAAGAKPGAPGPSGMSGGTGASIKWIEALVEEA